MDVYCSSESGLMALGNFSHHWPVQGCHIFGFYTSYHLRKSLSTLRTCSKDPSDHQLKKESFAYELSYSLRQAGGNAKRRMLLKVFRFKKRRAFYFCLIASPHLTSPHLTSPHLTSPHLTSPHLTSPHHHSIFLLHF